MNIIQSHVVNVCILFYYTLTHVLYCIDILSCCCFKSKKTKYASMTEEELKQAKAKAEAAPKAYADIKKMLQKALKIYMKHGKYIGTDFCIFSTQNNSVTPEILLSRGVFQ